MIVVALPAGKDQALAASGINNQINYQGKLLNSASIPVASGTYSITFSLYDAESGGNRIWTSSGSTASPSAINVGVANNGLFSILLGSGAQNSLDSVDWNSDSIYLGVTVGSDSEMTPRKRFGAVAQAFNAERWGGYMTASSVQSGENVLLLSQTSADAAASDRSTLVLTTSGTSDVYDYLLKMRNDSADVFTISRQGNATTTGNLAVLGQTILGTASSDTVVLNSSIASNVLPDANGIRDLGSALYSWRNIYASGTAAIQTLNVSGTSTFSGRVDAYYLNRWFQSPLLSLALTDGRATTTVGTGPSGIAFDGAYMWVANYTSNNVSKIDVSTNAVVATTTVGTSPIGVAFDGSHIWVTNNDSSNVSKIDVSTNAVVATVDVGTNPFGIAFDGNYVWVANQDSGNVSKIDVSTNTVVATVGVGAGPFGIAFDGAYMWVANYGSNNVSKIDVSTNAVVATVGVGTSPRGIAFDGAHLWVTNDNSNNVSKIDVSTNAVVATVDVGAGPRGIAFDGAYMWVANYGPDNVSKIDVSTNSVVATVDVGTNPFGIAFDGSFMWVANFNTDNVSKIPTGGSGTGADYILHANLRPDTNNAFDIGSALYSWQNIYASGTDSVLRGLNFTYATGTSATTTNFFTTYGEATNFISTNFTYTNATATNLYLSGNFSAGSSTVTTLNFTNATGSSLFVTSLRTDGDILPASNNSYDIGSPTLSWQNIYASGTGSIFGGLTFTSATGTSATTTNFFTTYGEATNFISTNFTYTNATGSSLFVTSLRTDGDILPATNNVYDIGSPLYSWRNFYASGTAAIQTLNVSGTSTFSDRVDADYIDRWYLNPKLTYSQYGVRTTSTIGGFPSDMAFDGSYLWIANFSSYVQKLDVLTGEVVATTTVGSMSRSVVFDGSHIWVANVGSANVSKIDIHTSQVVATVSVGSGPMATAFDGNYVWVVNQTDETVSKIDISTNTVTATISVGGTPNAIEFDGRYMWVSNSGDDTLSKIDINTNSIVKTIAAPGDLVQDFAFDGQYMWMVEGTDDALYKLDVFSDTIVFTTTIGNSPNGIIYDGKFLWITHNYDGGLEKYDARTLALLQTYHFNGIASTAEFDGNYIWVGDYSGTVTRIMADGTFNGGFTLRMDLAADINNAFDIGSASKSWKDIYASGTLYVGTDVVVNGQSVCLEDGTNCPATPYVTSATTTVGEFPGYIAFDGDDMWVSNFLDDSVSKINIATNEVVATVTVGTEPYGVAFDGTYIWVANTGSDNVSKIDVSTNSVVATVAVGDEPWGVAFDGSYLWASNFSSDNVSKIDISANAVVATTGVGSMPFGMAFDGGYMWVTNYGDSTVSKINISTNSVEATPAVGSGPWGAAFDGTAIWVANYDGNTASKINISTNSVIATVPTGQGPSNLALGGGYIWVTNYDDNNVSKIDISTNTVVATSSVGSGPDGIATDDTYMWVVNQGSNDVTKIPINGVDNGYILHANLLPSETDTYDIGSPTLSWKNIYASGTDSVLRGLNFTYATGTSATTTNFFTTYGEATNFITTNFTYTNATATNLYLSGNFSAGSSTVTTLNFTNATGSSLFVTSLRTDGDILPASNNSYDIGSPTLSWQNIYASGTAYIGGDVRVGGNTSTVTNDLFQLTGNDLFVAGNIGSASSVYSNGAFIAGNAMYGDGFIYGGGGATGTLTIVSTSTNVTGRLDAYYLNRWFTSPLLYQTLTSGRATTTVGEGPQGIAFDGAYMWVANADSNTVSKIDVSTNSVVATTTVGDSPIAIAFDGAYMWVANADSNTVSKIDVSTNSVVATVSVSTVPVAIAFDGAYMWVANYMDYTVSKIDVSTNSVVATVSVGTVPQSIAFDGAYMWVANTGSDTVSKIDVSTNSVVATVPVGAAPYAAAFDGSHMWVVNWGSDTVSKIDVSTNAVVATTTVGTDPAGVAFDGTHMWVANNGSDNVSKIDVSTNAVVATMAVGTDPAGVAFDGTHMWVANNGSANISKIPIGGGYGADYILHANLRPDTTNIFDLGSPLYSWKDIYASGTIYGTEMTMSGTSTFLGGIVTGAYKFTEDAGFVPAMDMSVTDAPDAGTQMSYTFNIDGIPFLKMYSEADSAGGIQNTEIRAYQNLVPSQTNSIDLGSPSRSWQNIYASGTIYGADGLFSGSVGIGTNNPQGTLVVKGTDDDLFVLSKSSTVNGDGAELIFHTSTFDYAGTDSHVTAKIKAIRLESGAAGDLAFYTRISGATSEKMRITKDGNVGIGTIAPSEKLTVGGNVAPSSTNAYDLGTPTYSWQNIYASGTIHGVSAVFSSSTNAVLAGDGTAANPAFSFSSEPDTGIYLSTGAIAFSVYGGLSFTIDSSAIVSNNRILPSGNNIYDLGTASVSWKDIYASGTIYGSEMVMTGTSTFTGGIVAGAFEFTEDAGFVPAMDMSVSDAPAAGTQMSYVFNIDGTPFLKMYSEADSSGGIQNEEIRAYQNIIPSLNNSIDLGSPSRSWQNIYASGTLMVGDGSLSDPSIAFGGDTNTGFYSYTTDQIGVSAGGVNSAYFLTSGIKARNVFPITTNTFDLGSGNLSWKDIYASGTLMVGDGSVSAPSITFGSDTNTGFYSVLNEGVAVTINGTAKYGILNSKFRPALGQHNSIDLGQWGTAWRDIYASGTFYGTEMLMTGTSTFTGGIVTGAYQFTEDAGFVPAMDMSVSDAPAAGTQESYSFKIDGVSFLKMYAEADNAGGIQNTEIRAFQDFVAYPNNTYNIGSALSSWKDVYASGTIFTNDVSAYHAITTEFRETNALGEYITSVAGLATSGQKTMKIQGRYAYIISTDNILYVLDISDPYNPSLESNISIDAGGTDQDLQVHGRYAYILHDGSDRLSAVDILDPSNPVDLGYVGVTIDVGTNSKFDVDGRYAYIIGGSDQMAVIDISDPDNMAVVSAPAYSWNATANPRGITVRDGLAYVLNYGDDSLNILDVSDPMDVTLTGSSTHFGIFDMAVEGNRAYLVGNNSPYTLYEVDVTSSTNPSILSTQSLSSGVRGIVASGKYVYVFNSSADGYAFDFTSSTNVIAARFDNAHTLNDTIDVQGRYIYAWDDANDDWHVFEPPGIEAHSLYAGTAEIGDLMVSDRSVFDGDVTVTDSFTVEGSAFIHGSMAIEAYGTSTAQAFRVNNGECNGESDGYLAVFTDGSDVLVSIRCDGSVHADAAYSSGGGDYAEYFIAEGTLPATGEVVALNNGTASTVMLGSTDARARTLGVVSDRPAVIGRSELESATSSVIVGLMGQLDVKVSAASSSIAIGDQLMMDANGYAVKAKGPGMIIGTALESLASGMGTVMTYVNPHWWAGDLLAVDANGNARLMSDLEIASSATASTSTSLVSSPLFSFNGTAYDQASSAVISSTFHLLNEVVSTTTARFTIASDATSTSLLTVSEIGDVAIAGRFYPSDTGSIQYERYIYYDGSDGAGGDRMRTNAAGWGTGSYDFAEMFPSHENLEPGDIVVVDPTDPEHVKKSSSAYEGAVVGIVSTQPGFLAGDGGEGEFPIALSGRVPTKVTTENGTIRAGDYLAASSEPGRAMKATEAGPTVGIALENYDGTSASTTISAYVYVGWFGGIEDGGSGTEGTGFPQQGFAKIAAGDRQVHVQHDSVGSYPMVVATPYGLAGSWWITNQSDVGFTIVIENEQTADVIFTWFVTGTPAGMTMWNSDNTSNSVDPLTGDPIPVGPSPP